MQLFTIISSLWPTNLIHISFQLKVILNTLLELITMRSSLWPNNLIHAACHRKQYKIP